MNFSELECGKLYRLESWHLLVFPTLENLITASLRIPADNPCIPGPDVVQARLFAGWWRKQLNARVVYIAPSETFMIVAIDTTRNYIKILGPNNQLGWIDMSHVMLLKQVQEITPDNL